MTDFLDLGTPAKRFRFIAVAEACSWAALLIAMGFKYIPEHGSQAGVQVCGWIHGIMFIAYIVLSLTAARALRWPPGITILALVAGVPPLCSVVFERWAASTGRLGELSGGDAEPVVVGS